MSLQQYVRQLRPHNESYVPHTDKVQTLLSEGFTVPISTTKDVSSFVKKFDYSKKDLNQLIGYLKGLRLGPASDLVPLAGDPANGNFKIRHAKGDAALVNQIKDWVKENIN